MPVPASIQLPEVEAQWGGTRGGASCCSGPIRIVCWCGHRATAAHRLAAPSSSRSPSRSQCPASRARERLHTRAPNGCRTTDGGLRRVCCAGEWRSNMAKRTTAFVAILDALGAAHYSREQAERFLESRDVVAKVVERSAEESLKYFSLARLGRFVFQDTVILTYLTDGDDDFKALQAFGHVLRSFQCQSLLRDILLRGAFSHGEVFRNRGGYEHGHGACG